MKRLYQHNHVTFDYDINNLCLLQTWQGFVNTADWIEIHNQLLVLADNHNIVRIISDTRRLTLVKRDDVTWVADDVTKRLVSKGLLFIAFVLPTTQFAQMSVNNYTEQAQEHLLIQHFAELEEAKQWINSA